MRPIAAVRFASMVGLVLVAGPGASAEKQAPKPVGEDALGYMAEGYFSNRVAFSHVRCRFRVIRGTAATVQDAMEGKLKDPIRFDGLWLVREDKMLFQLKCDPVVLKRGLEQARIEVQEKLSKMRKEAGPSPGLRGGEGFSVTVPCANQEVLKFGGRALSHSAEIAGANLFVEDTPPPEIRETPFGMNVMGPDEAHSPGSLIQKAMKKNGLFTARFEGTDKVRGVETLVAGVEDKVGNRWKFYLDPRRGFVPLLYWMSIPPAGKKLQQADVLEIRACSQGRWFPLRSVVIHDSDDPPPLRVERYEVVELEVDAPPPDDQFFLDLPAGTQVSVPKGGSWFITLTHAERVGAQDLQALEERIARRAELLDEPKPLAEQPAPFTGFRLAMVVVGAIVLVVLVAVSVLSSRRKPVEPAEPSKA